MSDNPLKTPNNQIAVVALATFLVAFLLLMFAAGFGFFAAFFIALLIALVATVVFFLVYGSGRDPLQHPGGAADPGPATAATAASDPADATAGETAASDPAGETAASDPAGETTDAADEVTGRMAEEAVREPEAWTEPAGSVPDTAGPGEEDDHAGVGRVGEGTRPAGLYAPREGQADDLKLIKGIGPKLEKLCNSLGFWHFDQIAAWTAEEVEWVDANLEGFKGRVIRDNWVEQAGILAAGGETEFSKRAEGGDAD